MTLRPLSLVNGHRRPKDRRGDSKRRVYVVDDDDGVREGVASLCRSIGLDVVSFSKAQEFLAYTLTDDEPTCLIVDVRLPGMSGLELAQTLRDSGVPTPIIFISGYGDIPMTVAAMKRGAVDSLVKPFREQELLDAVNAALLKDSDYREEKKKVDAVKNKLANLTTREHEVLGHVLAGRLNKQIAFDLGVSVVTVKVHRSNMMRKMDVRSLADLTRIIDEVGPTAGPSKKIPDQEQ